MKLQHLALALCIAWSGPASALGVDADQLPDKAQEAQARAIMKELRCLVCQNQSIEDSNAELAHDLRTLVRQRVAAGDDAAAVKAYLVERYGDWILLQPPLTAATLLLWMTPAALALGGGLLAWRYVRRNRSLLAGDAGDPA